MYTHHCRYVQQEVVLPGTSTVWEYLTFHASLRLPADTPPERIQARVAAVAEQLGLSKVCGMGLGRRGARARGCGSSGISRSDEGRSVLYALFICV